MAYNTQQLLRDANGNFIPQYFNPVTGAYEVINGAKGGQYATIIDANGNVLFSQSNPANVQLTGSNAPSGGVVSITTANTAQQLPNVSAKNTVSVIALKGNTGTVYVGFSSTVTNTSFAVELDPKETYDFGVMNADLMWIYGNAGDGVSYVAL